MSDSIFNKRSVVIILSVIWGLGIAILFKRECVDGKCIIIKAGPGIQHIRDGESCYQLTKHQSECIY